MNTKPLHKYAKLFPLMEGEDFAELVSDVQINGLRDKIVLFKGEVLDGQNRQAACEAAKRKPTYENFKGSEKQALEFVISKNFKRRHLTTSQRSMIAAEIAKGEVTNEDAAKQMHVSRDSVQTAKRIKKASPKLAKKVKAGKMSLNAAEKKTAPKRTQTSQTRDYSSVYSSAPASKAIAKETPKDTDTRSIGQICHDAFKDKMGEVSPWDDLTPKERSAWIAAAEAVKG